MPSKLCVHEYKMMLHDYALCIYCGQKIPGNLIEKPKEVVLAPVLPDFLYYDSQTGTIRVGVHGDSDVTDQWNSWLEKIKQP